MAVIVVAMGKDIPLDKWSAITDYSAMPDHTGSVTEYSPPRATMLLDAEQARLLSDPSRADIIQLLADRPASIKQLAEAMGRPRGSVGHHIHALEQSGIIAVVATRQVRAITEKFYGRLARTYVFPPLDEAEHPPFLVEAMAEIREPREGEAGMFTIRHARIPDTRAEAFADELVQLAEEFAARPRGGSTTYGFLIGLYPTDRPSLKEDE